MEKSWTTLGAYFSSLLRRGRGGKSKAKAKAKSTVTPHPTSGVGGLAWDLTEYNTSVGSDRMQHPDRMQHVEKIHNVNRTYGPVKARASS